MRRAPGLARGAAARARRRRGRGRRGGGGHRRLSGYPARARRSWTGSRRRAKTHPWRRRVGNAMRARAMVACNRAGGPAASPRRSGREISRRDRCLVYRRTRAPPRALPLRGDASAGPGPPGSTASRPPGGAKALGRRGDAPQRREPLTPRGDEPRAGGIPRSVHSPGNHGRGAACLVYRRPSRPRP